MSLFFSTKLKRNLLEYVFTHPGGSFYVRELSGLIGQDPGNLSRELRKLEAEGVFVSRVKGREKFYSLDKKYPLYSELKNIVIKTKGL
jgi:DNA-binding MarR family transcriptional regulator